MSKAPASSHYNPPITTRHTVLGIALFAWLWLSDLVLRALAQTGGCPGDATLDFGVLLDVWAPEPGCTGYGIAGDAIRLHLQGRPGAFFGMGGGLLEGMGPVWGLLLLALATVVTILVLRWKWVSGVDTLPLACIWAGAFILGVPRVLGSADGAALASLQFFGITTSLGDLALLWGLAWLGWRAAAEATA